MVLLYWSSKFEIEEAGKSVIFFSIPLGYSGIKIREGSDADKGKGCFAWVTQRIVKGSGALRPSRLNWHCFRLN